MRAVILFLAMMPNLITLTGLILKKILRLKQLKRFLSNFPLGFSVRVYPRKLRKEARERHQNLYEEEKGKKL